MNKWKKRPLHFMAAREKKERERKGKESQYFLKEYALYSLTSFYWVSPLKDSMSTMS
jgi:hypothetical protein